MVPHQSHHVKTLWLFLFVGMLLLHASSLYAFELAPDQHLPTPVTYSCSDDVAPNMAQAFGAWDAACDGLLAPTRTDSNAAVSATFVQNMIDGEYAGFTAMLGRRAVVRVAQGTWTQSAVLHELGHALGIQNSSDAASIMWPQAQPEALLSDDDVAAIRAAYGLSPRQWFTAKVRGRTVTFSALVSGLLEWRLGDGLTIPAWNGKKPLRHRYPRGTYQVSMVWRGIRFQQQVVVK